MTPAGRPAVLVLTMFDDDAGVHGAIRAGASGSVLKDAHQDALLRAILVKLHAADRAEAIVLAREAGLGRREGRPDEFPG